MKEKKKKKRKKNRAVSIPSRGFYLMKVTETIKAGHRSEVVSIPSRGFYLMKAPKSTERTKERLFQSLVGVFI